MSTPDNDGGPAFPHDARWESTDGFGHVMARGGNVLFGMSLRDWFAGMALTNLCAQGTEKSVKDFAEAAYRYADAMLAQRKAPHD